jgi:hypothetical protein
MKFINLAGKRFGSLTVKSVACRDRHGHLRWNCICDCGRVVVAAGGHLRRHQTLSCGCAFRRCEVRLDRSNHGRSTPEYLAWRSMWTRCCNPNSCSYRWYGARGITVCAQWRFFRCFISDMGPRPSPQHSLDRINSNGHYEPENCRWATPLQQSRNKQNNRIIECYGRKQLLVAWAEEAGMNERTLRHRLDKGMPIELALTAPVRKRGHSAS